ncbi:MAG: RdgB/HAM1 family non-canonical purine NTP pyrophosphatase [Candidatus Omnitrophota bacterium]
MMELIVATRNKHKLKEIKLLLKGIPITVRSLDNFKDVPEVIEDEPTLEGNAKKKAIVVSRFLKKLAIADDSGLEVNALSHRPGVYSARFSGKGATYKSNNEKVLRLLKGVPISKRGAKFRCLIAIADKGKVIKVVEGNIEGIIGFKPKGSTGFGYDPIFMPKGYKKTFSQMSLKKKNEISHRSKALIRAKKAVIDYIS